tara:strand:+ start:112 stop:705 length:594 start_codon:yes stop_codon:yes gene_type:complete
MSKIKLNAASGGGSIAFEGPASLGSDKVVKLSATPGVITQVVTTVKTDVWSSTADFSFEDVTGLSVTITPSSTSSKILVITDVVASSDLFCTYLKLLRGSTEIANTQTGAQSNQPTIFSVLTSDGTSMSNDGLVHLHRRSWVDSPSTTSATTYKIQSTARNGNYNAYINRTTPDRNHSSGEYDPRYTSTIQAMEIAG